MEKRSHNVLCKAPGLGLQKWGGEWLSESLWRWRGLSDRCLGLRAWAREIPWFYSLLPCVRQCSLLAKHRIQRARKPISIVHVGQPFRMESRWRGILTYGCVLIHLISPLWRGICFCSSAVTNNAVVNLTHLYIQMWKYLKAEVKSSQTLCF